MSRKLASIQKIWKIEPIENADAIELVHVLGWQCVAKKGEFKEGDLCVYFEIDSFLPCTPEFEFLRASSYKVNPILGEGYRLRTKRMRGALSQGLVLPVESCSALWDWKKSVNQLYHIGEDVTDILGVHLWVEEERATTGGTTIGSRPDGVPHTDETRCFDGKTKVMTNQGLVTMMYLYNHFNEYKDLKVLSYNINAGQIEWDNIKNVQRYDADRELCTLTIPLKYGNNRTNKLTGTLDHLILTSDGWKKMQEIKTGDTVFLSDMAYSKEVIPFIAGMLLGDSSWNVDNRKHKDGKKCYKGHVGFTQGEKQLEYLKEKLRILGHAGPLRKTKSGYCENSVYQSHLQIDNTILQWFNQVCKDNKIKHITKEYVDSLTPISLAFWYMDDGSLTFHKNHPTWQPFIRLNSHGYKKEENELLCEKLKDFGLNPKIYTDKYKNNGASVYYYIALNRQDTIKFQDIVAPYICPSMRYKLDNDHANIPYVLEDYTVQKYYQLFPVKVLGTKTFTLSKYVNRRYVYNLETETNHNYFASRILVHNCQSCPELLELFRDKKYYITSKCDGSSHSVFIDADEKFHVTGHNYEYKDDGTSSFYEYVKKNDIESKIRVWKRNQKDEINTICVQGEWCGIGIQKNRLKLQQPKWFVFTLIINGERCGLDRLNQFIHNTGIDMVPLEETGVNLPEKYPDIDALLKRAEIKYPCGSNGEGIVIRTVIPEKCNLTDSGYLSMKVINNKYLLKNGD